ncbi:MAG: tyrosine-type recombinase/integrase [Caldilineaceae bacterium SB0668_bin_21]|nr:tyrosine-type recombinase/integrase [Caldilineaceae bacterium SB0668_bin_21]MYC24000.1 tyrosine-type recombinase/integrase [Caldilineaceae bacterium SB0662_bin_25]
MQTDQKRMVVIAEVHEQAPLDRRRYQAMSDTLSEQARRAIAVAYSDNTRRAYVAAWDRFCQAVGPSRAMPATPETVANYLAMLAEEGKSVATIRLAAAAISAAHRAAGDVDSPCSSPVVKTALKGISRQNGQAQIQASALDAAALDAIRATAMLPRTGRRGVPEAPDYATARGQVDIALCSVLSDGGLRRTEAAALTWGDVETAANGSGRVRLARSKTDQEGEGEVVAITASTVQALDAIRNGAGMEDSVFGMSESTIARRVKAAAAAAGLGNQFSGHSGRVGLAQRMTAAGASAQAVMVQGRWKNAGTVARYTKGIQAGAL